MSKASQKVDDFFTRITKGVGLKPETVGTFPLGYEGAKKKLFGIPVPELGVSEFLNLPNFGKANERIEKRKKEREEDKAQSGLGDSFNQKQLMKDLYGLQAQQSILRDYEMGREAKRNMAAAQQYFQMAGAGQESAARRRLMEDTFSPTKISQQRLRAQQGEAALMNAVANQTSAAAQVGGLGTGRRYGR